LPEGFRAAGLACGLKGHGELDLGLLVANEAVPAAAIYTQNRLVGAHVTVCRKHLVESGGLVRAVLVNSRNANCATGQQGIDDALLCCRELADRLGCAVEQVLMISTGVIGAMLPKVRIIEHLDQLVGQASADGGHDFARGSGMMHRDMATMLSFLLTDGDLGSNEAGMAALRRLADRTMHRVTVDGDTSPNDTMLLLHSRRVPGDPELLEAMLTGLGADLARHVAADGEGASRLVTVEVRGARSEAEAAHVGRVIATSPLVKTAIAGRDPNWGRILSAAGRAGVAFDSSKARVWVGDSDVYRDGIPHAENEPDANRHLADEGQVRIGIDLALGMHSAEVWTCDLTADYVRINADYRT